MGWGRNDSGGWGLSSYQLLAIPDVNTTVLHVVDRHAHQVVGGLVSMRGVVDGMDACGDLCRL